MTSAVDRKLREVLESIPSEKFDKMMCSRFKCFFCREPSSCLAVLEWEGKEVWRYLCKICYDLLEKEDFESLEKRLREKGIVRCMMYRPLSDGGKREGEYIFRKRSEL